jgi:hypothetical protein
MPSPFSRDSSFAPQAFDFDAAVGLPPADEPLPANGYLSSDGKPVHVPTTMEEARALFAAAVSRASRKLARPEWFNGTDVRIHNDVEVPPDIQSAFDRAFASLCHVEGAREAMFLHFHPLWKRWAVMQDLGDGRTEIVWLVEGPRREGWLPADLSDPMWEHCRGRVGAYRRPTFNDFVFLLDVWLKARTDDEIEAWFYMPEQERDAEAERVLREREYDTTKYYGLAIHRFEHNHGRRSSAAHSEPLTEQERPSQVTEIQRAGYKVRVGVGTRAEAALLEEAARERADAFDRSADIERGTLRDAARRATAAAEAVKGGRNL